MNVVLRNQSQILLDVWCMYSYLRLNDEHANYTDVLGGQWSLQFFSRLSHKCLKIFTKYSEIVKFTRELHDIVCYKLFYTIIEAVDDFLLIFFSYHILT